MAMVLIIHSARGSDVYVIDAVHQAGLIEYRPWPEKWVQCSYLYQCLVFLIHAEQVMLAN